jgi:hypothetical protein
LKVVENSLGSCSLRNVPATGIQFCYCERSKTSGKCLDLTSPNEAYSLFSDSASAGDTDPGSEFWSAAPSVLFDRDPYGAPQADLPTEVRSRWTVNDLYLLFRCAYSTLYVRPNPNLSKETNELWNWDVAEVFLGSDFDNIRRYKEFEVSPQGEWVDLDVDLDRTKHEDGWTWSSGCQVSARIDAERKVWFAAIRIPWSAIIPRRPIPGEMFRVNFCRTHGVERRLTIWQPTMRPTFHVPEVFGTLRLTNDDHVAGVEAWT